MCAWVQMRCMWRMHRRHMTAWRRNRTGHAVMSASIYTTAAGTLLLLYSRHWRPLLMLLLVLVLMLRGHWQPGSKR